MGTENGLILVVDDSRLIRSMLTNQLEEEGYSVRTAENGEEALELIGQYPFDTVLLDIMMPGISGIEVLKRIRETRSRIELPVIMVTSKDDTEMIVTALDLGANDYVTKPVDFPVVLARIKTQISLKHSEEELKMYSQQLEQSNKLKDLFIDIMGHDLLKPADIMRLSTELVLDQEDDPKKRKILEGILQSSERIIDLIENATVLAKLESGIQMEFNEGDLAAVIREVIDELGENAGEKNMVIQHRIEGDFPAKVNPLIYNVFSNLLGNAIKYGPEGSQIFIEIYEDGLNWRISIKDNGEGIPERHKASIFDRFKRLEKGGVKGSGLGLAIVKKVVDAHKGRVWVEDNPEGGSIFFVEIPKSGICVLV